MSHATSTPRREETPSHPALDEETESTADVETLLDLLSDEYARTVLSALGEESLPARALAERLEMSRATVYRRLDGLEEAGLVESTMSVHPEGNHRKRFRASLDRLELAVEDGDLVLDRLA